MKIQTNTWFKHSITRVTRAVAVLGITTLTLVGTPKVHGMTDFSWVGDVILDYCANEATESEVETMAIWSCIYAKRSCNEVVKQLNATGSSAMPRISNDLKLSLFAQNKPKYDALRRQAIKDAKFAYDVSQILNTRFPTPANVFEPPSMNAPNGRIRDARLYKGSHAKFAKESAEAYFGISNPTGSQVFMGNHYSRAGILPVFNATLLTVRNPLPPLPAGVTRVNGRVEELADAFWNIDAAAGATTTDDSKLWNSSNNSKLQHITLWSQCRDYYKTLARSYGPSTVLPAGVTELTDPRTYLGFGVEIPLEDSPFDEVPLEVINEADAR